MKKRIVRTFCAIMLGSILLITVGITMAAEPGYERFSYPAQVVPTIDGMWTSEDEWTDGDVTWIGTDVAFRSTWEITATDVITQWIVEFFSDTTNDPEDYWQFCIDGDQSGSASMHWMFKILGHNELVWYIGGVGGGVESWMETSGVEETEVEWADSLNASPTNSTPHWILEFQIGKNEGQVQMDNVWNFLLGVNDASNPGFQAWPPTDPYDADTWGVENFSSEPIPEGLTFGVMALLSTVSVLVGYKYFGKRKETKAQ